MKTLSFNTAADATIPFRSLAVQIPRMEMSILDGLRRRTGLDIERLFDCGRSVVSLPSDPAKQFAVSFSQTRPCRTLPLFLGNKVDLRVSLTDVEKSLESARCSLSVFRGGGIKPYENETMRAVSVARGSVVPDHVTPLHLALGNWPAHAFDVAPDYRYQGLGTFCFSLTNILAARIYGGRCFSWAPITPDSQPFYEKVLGADAVRFRTSYVYSAYHGDRLPIVRMKYFLEPALMKIFGRSIVPALSL